VRRHEEDWPVSGEPIRLLKYGSEDVWLAACCCACVHSDAFFQSPNAEDIDMFPVRAHRLARCVVFEDLAEDYPSKALLPRQDSLDFWCVLHGFVSIS